MFAITLHPRKCSVKFGAIWTRDTPNINNPEKQQIPHCEAAGAWLQRSGSVAPQTEAWLTLMWSHGEVDINKMEIASSHTLQWETKAEG